MKKLAIFMLVVMFAVAVATAQTYSGNSKNGLTGYDVLGAHNNGGRGCAGCHAPHSGANGGGGNVAANAMAFNDPNSGSVVLFGQDITPLYSQSLTFGNGYIENLPGNTAAYTTNIDELRGLMMCLACHDGQIAKGQMMTGQSWEQTTGILPKSVYGTRSIPTLLGNDSGNGNTSAYKNDHPAGTQATLGALGLVTANGAQTTDHLKVTVVSGAITNIVPQSPAYMAFAVNYGYPALAGTSTAWGVSLPNGNTDPASAFITCTTCHNQHVMYVYQSPTGKMTGSAIAGNTYPTYFFVNGPYNPGAGNASATLAASSTQFCRQCHIDMANESYGINGVQTQF